MAFKKIEGFSKNATQLYRIATMIAGFDAGELMKEIHRRAPNRATEATVCEAMQTIRDRYEEDDVPPSGTV